jgi:hypothetical protein
MQPNPINQGPISFSVFDETEKYSRYHQTFTNSLTTLQTNLMDCFERIFSGPGADIEAAVSGKNDIVKKQVELATHVRCINSALEVLKNPNCTKEMLDCALSREREKNSLSDLKIHYYRMVANLVKEVLSGYRSKRDELESTIGTCLGKMMYATEKPDLPTLISIRKEANDQLLIIKHRILITNLIAQALEQPDCEEAKIDALFRRFAEEVSDKMDIIFQLEEKKEKLLRELQDVGTNDPEKDKFKQAIVEKYRDEMTRMFEDSICIIQESSEERVLEKHLDRIQKIKAFLEEIKRIEHPVAAVAKRPFVK